MTIPTAKRALIAVTSLSFLAGSALTLTASPALATDGKVSSAYSGGGGGSAYATAHLDFTSSRNVKFNDIYLNDRCPGDDRIAILKFKVRYEGTTNWTTVGQSRYDRGGCKSDPWRGSASWGPTDKRINDATVVACVEGVGCASPGSSYRDNPHWGSH